MAYPKLTIDFVTHRYLADNIWHAQKAGHPKVMTYNGPDIVTRRATRKAAMHYETGSERFEIPRSLSRDEYPFACSAEGGRSSWVGHIPPRENSAQGGLIAAFLSRHQIKPGLGEQSKFEVEVVHHPEDAPKKVD